MEHDRNFVGNPPQSREIPDDEGKNSPTPEASKRGEEGRAQASKATRIREACNSNDVPMLIAHATSPQGLMEDRIRRLAWPILLGCKGYADTPTPTTDWRDLPQHRDEDQVRLDVNRSFVYYPSNQTEKELDRRKMELSDVITEVLRRHTMLCYFQGYHDIVQVLLLVLGKEMVAPAVAHLSLLRIRDFMLPSLSPALLHLKLLPSILHCVDPKLCHHLSQTRPFFALAATLTLYAHDIQEYGDIARLFDFLLAQEAVISIYLFAVIICSRSDELFEIPADEPEMLHSVLSKLPKPLDLESLIASTIQLYEQHPPQKLPNRIWSHISSNSVLKTTQNLAAEQTLDDGERLFQKQASELRRLEALERGMTALYKYRRPAGTVGLAILVGIVSFWLGREGPVGAAGSLFRKFKETLQLVVNR